MIVLQTQHRLTAQYRSVVAFIRVTVAEATHVAHRIIVLQALPRAVTLPSKWVAIVTTKGVMWYFINHLVRLCACSCSEAEIQGLSRQHAGSATFTLHKSLARFLDECKLLRKTMNSLWLCLTNIWLRKLVFAERNHKRLDMVFHLLKQHCLVVKLLPNRVSSRKSLVQSANFASKSWTVVEVEKGRSNYAYFVK